MQVIQYANREKLSKYYGVVVNNSREPWYRMAFRLVLGLFERVMLLITPLPPDDIPQVPLPNVA